jgi:hypothetical protein
MTTIRIAAALLFASLLYLPARAELPGQFSPNGRWEVTQAAIAPWVGDKVALVRESEVRKLLKQRITFSARAAASQYPALNCSEATYETTRLPAAGLFQGALPDPHQATFAKAIGFPSGEISGFDMACPNARFSFHFRDRDTLLFALDNVIYTLKRR